MKDISFEDTTMHPATEKIKGGWLACIAVVTNGEGSEYIRFEKPVFKTKKKALRYAARKLKSIMPSMRKRMIELGYDIEHNMPNDV